MEIARLQYISDGDLPCAESFLRVGGRWIQLRIKGAPKDEVIAVGRRFRSLCDAYGALLIVNDDPSIALAVDADGVHIGKKDGTLAEARRILGDGKIVGRTAHTSQDVIEASDADYIGLGALRKTATKGDIAGVLGYGGYRRIFEELKGEMPPVVAIGGIVADDIAPLLQIGLHGIAVSALIGLADDAEAVTREVLKFIDDEFKNCR